MRGREWMARGRFEIYDHAAGNVVRDVGRDVLSGWVDWPSLNGLRMGRGPSRTPVRHARFRFLDQPRAQYPGVAEPVQNITICGSGL